MKRWIACLGLLSLLCWGINEADYGAGELLEPGQTYKVDPSMNWWQIRAVGAKLKAGDTLEFAGGTYFVPGEMSFNVHDNKTVEVEQEGRKGAPIRLTSAPGQQAVLRGAEYQERKGEGQVCEFFSKKCPLYDIIQEYPSQIELQRVSTEDLVREYPGTFCWKEDGKVLVHFAALNQKGVLLARARIGIRIHGSWYLVENLRFENFYEGIYMRMNMPYDQHKAAHITVRNCEFYHNYKSGFVSDGCSWSLFTLNHGANNTERGTSMTMPNSSDDLYTKNYFGPSPQTLRQKARNEYNFTYQNYGGGAKRIHLLQNVLDDEISMRWKPGCPDSVIERNLMTGRWYAESSAVPAVFKDNCIAGTIGWSAMGYSLTEESFKDTPMKFSGTIKDPEQFRKANPDILAVEALKQPLPTPEFPPVVFEDVSVGFIGADGATVQWKTPENDGWGSVSFWKKGSNGKRTVSSGTQGTRHRLGLTGLAPNTDYEYQLSFKGRRYNSGQSQVFAFRTVAENRKPMTLEVGEGKMSLGEASCAVLPGDTVLLLPGRHYEQFIPVRGGTPEQPITLKAEKGAILDGQQFYSRFVSARNMGNFIIDGLVIENPESKNRQGLLYFSNCRNITVRNCYAKYWWEAGVFIRFDGTGLLFERNVSWGGDYPVTTIGKNILIRNNTIVDATMMSTSLWDSDNVVLENNIFYRPCIPQKRNNAICFNNEKGVNRSDNNVFWSPVKEHPMGGTIRDLAGKILKKGDTLEEWQKVSGMDTHSIHADPLFIDYEKGDFHLKPGSPAEGKGAF